MDSYRFIGTKSEVGPFGFDRFGQQVRMTPEAARNAQLGGCQLVPEKYFNDFQFTEEDLKVWSDPFMDPFDVPADAGQAEAKAQFLAKLASAQHFFSVLRQGLVLERSTSKKDTAPAKVEKKTRADEKE